MDFLSKLKYAEGSRKKKKRVGRGEGSGHGGQATRGMNGQMSRSGAKHRAWFEGGQMPLQRRVPKYGFTSPFKIYYQVINVSDLQKVIETKKTNETEFNSEVLHKLGLIKSKNKPIKVLGNGNLKIKVNLEVNACSNSAKEKVEAQGGTIKLV
ncbi:MAG: 50S ribosomal protein L15 [Ignavibacteriales bacterium]|nr:50S ribosomal protein L15 [Ignavibacteriales bacterium]HPO55037.1 50S ribosomal protein L15 [Ignavibacteriaceae bacterium]